MGEADDEEPADDVLGDLGGAVLGVAAFDRLLQQVVKLAHHAVNGAHSATITVVTNGGYRTSNSTEATALAVDEVQYDKGDGPCLEAMRTRCQLQVLVDAVAERWPHFADKADEIGIVGVVSIPLLRGSESIGALNIYARDGSFADHELRTAEIIGDLASVLLANTFALHGAFELNDQLRGGLASREVIGEAKGILMERESCTRDAAFDILRRASQRENRKLRELAEDLVSRAEARARDRRPRP